jgi:hypothetical protein
VWSMFFPLMRLSNRATAYALCRRLIASNRYNSASPADRIWPHCEAWLPSVVCGSGEFSCADFNSFGQTYYRIEGDFGLRPILWDVLAGRPEDGRLYHPVLTSKTYMEKTFWWHMARTGGGDPKEAQEFLDAMEECSRLGYSHEEEERWLSAARTVIEPFASARLSFSDIAHRHWRFRRADGTLLAPELKFTESGDIQGATHPNESRWSVREGHLLIFNKDGTMTTRFDRLRRGSDGRLILLGQFQLASGIAHILEEGGAA